MVDVSKLDPERPLSEIDDRRGEFNAWQQFLLDLGVPPIDHTARQGFALGDYSMKDFRENAPNPGPNPLSEALGINSRALNDPIGDYLRAYQPMMKKIPPTS